ncbi:hypothetical protein SAMN04488097_0671 [Epilithonimonas lactis]|nr:hypothetical protein SAMN04488097_0671 [Epilithonimonas lactis]
MAMKIQEYGNKEIKNAIIKSFLEKDPKYFIPFILSKNVFVDYWNKTKFYEAFKYEILKLEMKDGFREIKLEKQYWDYYDDYTQLNIYDNYHLAPRFTILFKDENEKIYLEFDPF